MDFWETLKVVYRRWYITVPAFFAALGLVGLVYAAVPHKYQSNAVVVLTAPPTGATTGVGGKNPFGITNPLLNFDQGLSLSASILIQALLSPETVSTLGLRPNDKTSYEVTNGSTNPELLITGPFLYIQGTSSSPEAAQDIVRKVAARASVDLAARQEQLNAPASTFISVSQVVPATPAVALKGGRLRAAGAAGVLAVVASLSAAFAFESFATRRKRRSKAAAPLTGVLPTEPGRSETFVAGSTG